MGIDALQPTTKDMSRMLRLTEAEFAQRQKLSATLPVKLICAIPKESPLEAELARQISAAGLPVPVRELKPLAGRRYRIDFAWPDLKLAVEVQGNAHRTKERFYGDMDKWGMLTMAGWQVLLVGRPQIYEGRAIEWLAMLLRRK